MKGTSHVIYMRYLEGSKPHEPVKAVVVGRYDAGTAAGGSWLALELNLLPYSQLSIPSQRAVVGPFKYDLRPLFCYTAHTNKTVEGKREGEGGKEGERSRERGKEGRRERG